MNQPVNWSNNYTKVFLLVHLFGKFFIKIYIKRFTGAKMHRFGFNLVNKNVIGTKF